MIKTFTQGVLGSASDLMLAAIHLKLSFVPPDTYTCQEEEAVWQNFMSLKFSTLKRSLVHLKSKNFVKTDRTNPIGYSITNLGIEYINSTLPKYKTNRFSEDGNRFFLVNYDLPITKNADRNALRYFLKKIGCQLLQHSVWLSLENPKKEIEAFLEKSKMSPGLITISTLNLKDGLIGVSSDKILNKLYDLDRINTKYREYLDVAHQNASRDFLIFNYFSVLTLDPQLLPQFLPPSWQGDNAHTKHLQILGV